MKKVYWKGRKKIKKLPPVKAAKKYMGRKRKDKLLYETLPAAYNAHKNEPVDERKVIFIELRLPDVSNSFRILYDELQRDFDPGYPCTSAAKFFCPKRRIHQTL